MLKKLPFFQSSYNVTDTLAYMWLSQNMCELCSGFITHHLHCCTWALLKGHLHTFSCDLLIYHCHSPLCLVWYLEPALFGEDFHSWEQLAISNTVASRWLRCIVTSHSLWSPNFDPRPVLVGFVVDKVALGQVFSPSTSVFPSHSHSTSAVYSFINYHFIMLEIDCIVKQHTNKKCHNQRQYFTLSPQGQSANGIIYYFTV